MSDQEPVAAAVQAGAAATEETATEHRVAEGSAGVDQHIVRAEIGEMNEFESMCPKCEENGTTRLMFAMIPHFKEIIVSSFECPHCHELNRSVQFGGAYGPKKLQYHLQVRDRKDLNRQVIKGDFATLSIPELDLELGPDAQQGSLNTVEGVLQQVRDGLEFQQPARKALNPELHDKIEAFIARLEKYQSLELPFDLWLEDPAGNSYIEGVYQPGAGHVDPRLTRFEVTRSHAERIKIGIEADGEYNTMRTDEEESHVQAGNTGDVVQLPQPCPACNKEGNVNIHETHIPHFGRIVIMAFKCEGCGYKSNEVKNAGDIPEKGRRITLEVRDKSDLSRDVLKSDSTSLHIPEIDLEMAPGTLGGFFTTVEGVLDQVHEQLMNLKQTAFEDGDSEHLHTATSGGAPTMKSFLEELRRRRDGEVFPFTIVLEDPMGLIYIQNPRSHLPPPQNIDPQLTVEDYVRSKEENEELGLE